MFSFFGNQLSKRRSFEKKGKLQKFLQHISHSHTYTYFAHPIDFFAIPILKKKIRIYQIRFLFGMSPVVDFTNILMHRKHIVGLN